MAVGSLQSRLVDLMSRRSITTESLALESGFSVAYIKRLRSGKQKNPTVLCVLCLARVLGVQPAYLAGYSDKE
jgi:transcriptional regulator with XRE-family HTH domain